MIKQQNLVKNSFTLLETLISITILSFIIGSFIKTTYYDESANENYILLNKLENKFDTNDFSNLIKSSKILTITINDSIKETINVNSFEYKDSNITLVKYEK